MVELVDALDAWFSQTTAPNVTEVLIQKLFPNSLCKSSPAVFLLLSPQQPETDYCGGEGSPTVPGPFNRRKIFDGPSF